MQSLRLLVRRHTDDVSAENFKGFLSHRKLETFRRKFRIETIIFGYERILTVNLKQEERWESKKVEVRAMYSLPAKLVNKKLNDLIEFGKVRDE